MLRATGPSSRNALQNAPSHIAIGQGSDQSMIFVDDQLEGMVERVEALKYFRQRCSGAR